MVQSSKNQINEIRVIGEYVLVRVLLSISPIVMAPLNYTTLVHSQWSILNFINCYNNIDKIGIIAYCFQNFPHFNQIILFYGLLQRTDNHITIILKLYFGCGMLLFNNQSTVCCFKLLILMQLFICLVKKYFSIYYKLNLSHNSILA